MSKKEIFFITHRSINSLIERFSSSLKREWLIRSCLSNQRVCHGRYSRMVDISRRSRNIFI